MNLTRLLIHPVAKHERSRTILSLFIVTNLIVFGFLWWKIRTTAGVAQIDFSRIPSQPGLIFSIFLSPWFHFFLTLGCAIIAASITSFRTVGPIKRIEQWILDWEAGHDMGLLRVRKGDWYQELVEMVNTLYLKSKGQEKK